MITALLWDLDDTLLDFAAAERAAIQNLFREFGLGVCSEEMLQHYSEINRTYWGRLERGELTKPEVLVGRFREFFETEQIDSAIAEQFNQKYQLSLGDTIVYRDNSLDIVKSLRGRVKQYIVSNGTVTAQSKKLRRSGFGALMDGIFLSEQLGAEKPSALFFEQVFAALAPIDRTQIMIVGDSLSSDIQGGRNAGITTCWYDPHGKSAADGPAADHVISDLHEIYRLL